VCYYFQSFVWFLATFLQHFSLQDSSILLMAFFLFLINFLVALVHVCGKSLIFMAFFLMIFK
jgi:hypothetical protein